MIDGLTISAIIRRAATTYPSRTAIVYEGKRWTYTEYDRRVNQAAHLMTKLGIGFGEHVAVLGRNSIEYLELCHGAGRIGAVFGTINWRLAPKEISFIVTDGDAKVLFVEAGFQRLLEAVADELEGIAIVVYDGPPTINGALDYERLRSDTKADPVETVVSSGDAALIMYTSGTTGLPKGAVLTHGNVCWDAVSYLTYAAPQHGDCTLLSMPTNHVSGLHMVVNAFFLRALPIVIMRQWEPAEACRLISTHRVTHACILVTPMQQLLQYEGLRSHDLSSLRSVLTAAAKYTTEFAAKVVHELQLDQLWFAYGLTEAAPMVTVTEFSGEMAAKENTLGRPVWYVDVRVADDNDNALPAGTVGEILVRGPNVFSGYYKRDDANREVLRGGWLHTGDLGRFDEDGYLFFVDRKKDMIKSGGENVFSLEVEIGMLRAVPELLEAAVVGVPDEKWGEAVTAFVVLKAGAMIDQPEIIECCRLHLAGYKIPKKIHFCEELPKNVSGKVLKRHLLAKVTGGS